MPIYQRIWMLILVVLACGSGQAFGALTPVDLEDEAALEESASLAFHDYLQAIEAGELEEAYEMVLDPQDMAAQDDVLTRLSAFIKSRQKQPVSNEALIIRSAGDWALVVYQYDTIVAGKTARVITTAWMMQWEGFWRQFIVPPSNDDTFWEARRSDYEALQKWFDDHAQDFGSA